MGVYTTKTTLSNPTTGMMTTTARALVNTTARALINTTAGALINTTARALITTTSLPPTSPTHTVITSTTPAATKVVTTGKMVTNTTATAVGNGRGVPTCYHDKTCQGNLREIGCKTRFMTYVQENILIIGLVVAGIVLLEAFGICFACILSKTVDRNI